MVLAVGNKNELTPEQKERAGLIIDSIKEGMELEEPKTIDGKVGSITEQDGKTTIQIFGSNKTYYLDLDEYSALENYTPRKDDQIIIDFEKKTINQKYLDEE